MKNKLSLLTLAGALVAAAFVNVPASLAAGGNTTITANRAVSVAGATVRGIPGDAVVSNIYQVVLTDPVSGNVIATTGAQVAHKLSTNGGDTVTISDGGGGNVTLTLNQTKAALDAFGAKYSP